MMNEWFDVGLKAFGVGLLPSASVFYLMLHLVHFSRSGPVDFWLGLSGSITAGDSWVGSNLLLLYFCCYRRDCQYTAGSFTSCATYDLRDTIRNTLSARCICVPGDAGLVKLTGNIGSEYSQVLSETVHNGESHSSSSWHYHWVLVFLCTSRPKTQLKD